MGRVAGGALAAGAAGGGGGGGEGPCPVCRVEFAVWVGVGPEEAGQASKSPKPGEGWGKG